ncbi:MAG TPA: hypothetical protein VMT04_06905, partial [Terriglobales bacterium]|nr:hypothetical protein [Terriglobales bacterium]
MNHMRTLLEILYFLSGPLVALFVFLGLRQLKISKDSMRLSAKRESFRLAAERCTHYAEHIIPVINEYDRLLKEKGCEFMTKADIEVSNNDFKV